MKFDLDKIEKLRLNKKISMSKLCKIININRITYWRWQKGESVPTETNIRNIAKALDVSVQIISDLNQNVQTAPEKISPAGEIWNDFALFRSQKTTDIVNTMSEGLKIIKKDISNIYLIIKGLLTSTNIAFYIKDPQLKYIAANGEFLKNFSLDISYIVNGKTDSDFFPKNEAEFNSEQDEQVIRSGIAIKDHENFIPGTRHKAYGLISKLPIYDSENIIGLIGIFVDITERKKTEEIKNLLEFIIKNSDIAISIKDLKSQKIFFQNKKMADIIEYTGYELYNLDNSAFNLSKEINQLKQEYVENKINHPICGENKLVAKNGKTVHIDFSINIIRYNNAICEALFIRDITLERAEQELKEILKLCIDTVSDSVVVRDDKTFEILYDNGVFYSFLGAALFKNKNIYECYDTLVQGCNDEDKVKLREFLERKNSFIKIIFHYSTSKERKSISIQLQRKKILSKECMVIISRDVTELFLAQEEKFKAYEIISSLKNTTFLSFQIFKNEKYKVTYTNNFIEKITGYRAEQFSNEQNPLQKFIHHDYKSICDNLISISDGLYQYDVKIVCSDKKEKWCSLHLNIRTGINYTKLVDVVITDINESLLLKKELFAYYQQEMENAKKTECIKIAKNMIESGLERNLITKTTGISESELNKIQ